MEKLIKSFFSVLLLGILVTTSSTQVQAAYACSPGETNCEDASFGKYNTKKTTSSNGVLFSKGSRAVYQWQNEPTGKMHVNFAIYNGKGTRISSMLAAAGGGGSDYGTWIIPESGLYYLMAACEGGNDTRCYGGGRLSK